MKQKMILKALNDIDLNTYEAKSYLALLEKNNMTAVEVAKLSGVPRGRVYEALDNLALKGFCYSLPGNVKKYKAADPSILREKVKDRVQEYEERLSQVIEEQKTKVEALKNNSEEAINSLVPIFKGSRDFNNPLDYIEIIKDESIIKMRLSEIIGNMKFELLNVVKPPLAFSMGDDASEKSEHDYDVKQPDYVAKILFEIPRNESDAHKVYREIEYCIKNGEQAKVMYDVPMKMIIVDERYVVLPLKDPVSSGNQFTTQIVDNPALALGLKTYFEMLWEKADDPSVLKELLKL